MKFSQYEQRYILRERHPDLGEHWSDRDTKHLARDTYSGNWLKKTQWKQWDILCVHEEHRQSSLHPVDSQIWFTRSIICVNCKHHTATSNLKRWHCWAESILSPQHNQGETWRMSVRKQLLYYKKNVFLFSNFLFIYVFFCLFCFTQYLIMFQNLHFCLFRFSHFTFLFKAAVYFLSI